MRSGWILLGFLNDFPPGLSEVEIAGRPLLVVREAERVRVFDGFCPHRGARLVRGRHQGNVIICAFHGHPIGLGGDVPSDGDTRLAARAYRTFEIGELVFVHLGTTRNAPDCGLEDRLQRLRRDHAVVHGFFMDVPAGPETVVENAFDLAHFGPVHGVPDIQPPELVDAEWRNAGFDCTSGSFRVGASPWDPEPTGTPIEIGYSATAFSPALVLSEQDGSRPYRFLVGALPLSPRESRVHVALFMPREEAARPSALQDIEWLLGAMQSQLEADCLIWAGLPEIPVRNLMRGEEIIAAFWQFCDLFPELSPRECLA